MFEDFVDIFLRMLASGNDEEIEIADGFLAAAKRRRA